MVELWYSVALCGQRATNENLRTPGKVSLFIARLWCDYAITEPLFRNCDLRALQYGCIIKCGVLKFYLQIEKEFEKNETDLLARGPFIERIVFLVVKSMILIE